MDFEALMKQYMAGPGEDEIKRARMNAIAQAGLMTLAAPGGRGWQGALRAAGQGGLLGMDAYQRNLDGLSQGKRQGLQDAASLYGFKRQFEGDQRADKQRSDLEAARLASMMPGTPEMGPPTPQGGMQPAVPPSFDFRGYANRVANVDPSSAMQIQKTLLEMQPKKESPFGKINPADYTPESLTAFMASGDYTKLKPAGGTASPFAKIDPKDYTPASLLAFTKSNNYSDLVPAKGQGGGDGPGKAPPGYRWTKDGGLEAIPGGPAAEKAPPGYRVTPGGLEPIPGGPQDDSAQRAARKDAEAATAAIVLGKVSEARNMTGFFETGATGAARGMIPGTKAYDLRATVETIKANLGFEKLQKMREMSKTGGALGSIAVQELNLLTAAVASLDPNQSEDKFRKSLDDIERHYSGWQSAIAGKAPQKQQPKSGGPSVMDNYKRRASDMSDADLLKALNSGVSP